MMQIYDCEQGSDEWLKARLGIPTASEFHSVLAKGKGLTRRTYLLKLAGELLTGEPMERYSNHHMERGKEMEAEARALYEFQTDHELTRVGFVRNEGIIPDVVIGCSPDSLIGVDGALEVKTKLPHLQLEVLESGKVPSEHIAQCQGTLLVTGRSWVDFVSYWPKLPPFIKRVHRDEMYIAELRVELKLFDKELKNIVELYK